MFRFPSSAPPVRPSPKRRRTRGSPSRNRQFACSGRPCRRPFVLLRGCPVGCRQRRVSVPGSLLPVPAQPPGSSCRRRRRLLWRLRTNPRLLPVLQPKLLTPLKRPPTAQRPSAVPRHAAREPRSPPTLRSPPGWRRLAADACCPPRLLPPTVPLGRTRGGEPARGGWGGRSRRCEAPWTRCLKEKQLPGWGPSQPIRRAASCRVASCLLASWHMAYWAHPPLLGCWAAAASAQAALGGGAAWGRPARMGSDQTPLPLLYG